MNNEKGPGYIRLNNVRIAFVDDLFTPGYGGGTPRPDQKPAWSCKVILPPDHPQIGQIKKAMIAIAKEKWPKNYEQVLKALKGQDRLVLKDGDLKFKWDGFAGMLYINLRSSKVAPTVFDNRLNKIEERDGLIYSGCYVNVSFDVWAQDNQDGGQRLNAQLRGVQYAGKGDAFGAGAPASADEFDEVDITDEDGSIAETEADGIL